MDFLTEILHEKKICMCHLFAHLRLVCQTNKKKASTGKRILSKETSIIGAY
jgi:hypothetical protein